MGEGTPIRRFDALHLFLLLLLTAAPPVVVGCQSVQVDRSAARAAMGPPEAATVEMITLPYDANLPRFVVAVEGFRNSSGGSGLISGGRMPTTPEARGGLQIAKDGLKGGDLEGRYSSEAGSPGSNDAIVSMYKTALSQWPNVSILDPSGLVRQPDGTYTCRLAPGEIGPFIIRGTVTEFRETAELNESKRGGSLWRTGAFLGILGAAAGVPEAAYAGAGLSAANPTIQNEKMKRNGMVGLDLELVDGRSARMVRGFAAAGTFTTLSEVSGVSLFGVSGGSSAFAASALGQATRAATNDAATKTAEALKTSARWR
ncbi:hypothetical protein N9166_00070 [bacterium]|nr:hypothetical protein [bacterium]MDB4433116.1 hypothetical protein [bacterium]